MLTRKLRQRFWKLFDSWALDKPRRPIHRPTFQPRLEVLEGRIVPALWMVAGTGDLGQGMKNPPPQGGGEGDLRFCMNNAASGDTINFGVSGTISLSSALPLVTKDITINGAGQNVEIWGGNTYRIFQVLAGVKAEIDNLSIDDASTGGLGGGLNNAGSLTLKNDTFFSNQATQGGGAIYNAPDAYLWMETVSLNKNFTNGNGGGILNNQGEVYCEKHTSIVNNRGNGDNSNGGGIMNEKGFVQLGAGAQVTGNSATGNGGGAYTTGGDLGLSIAGTSGSVGIQYNSAQYGGGLYVNAGQVHITSKVEIWNNIVSKDGGGIYMNDGVATVTGGSIDDNSASGSGAGIYIVLGKLTLHTERLYNNQTELNGGGIYIAGGSVTATGLTVQNNGANNSGGGIYNNAGSLTLNTDNFFADNTAAKQGGGLYLAANSTTKFNSCSVTGNSTGGSQFTTGWGVYWQNNAKVMTPGLTDNDDPGGVPVKGP